MFRYVEQLDALDLPMSRERVHERRSGAGSGKMTGTTGGDRRAGRLKFQGNAGEASRAGKPAHIGMPRLDCPFRSASISCENALSRAAFWPPDICRFPHPHSPDGGSHETFTGPLRRLTLPLAAAGLVAATALSTRLGGESAGVYLDADGRMVVIVTTR